MSTCRTLLAFVCICGVAHTGEPGTPREITETELRSRIAGFWYGQLVGNYLGFPFENLYRDEPIPVLVDRYYDVHNAGDLRINAKDARGTLRNVVTLFDGAFSDDDTDIELVTLHAVEKYGLDITYPEMTEMWKRHINRRIWVANREARNLMERGLLPPATGSKAHNKHWFQIDPQLVNEIWSVFYPGLAAKAVERADWGAHITNDDWGTHPTRFYAAVYANAFFESDTRTLVEEATKVVPEDSPFAEGLRDVLAWHREHDDWRKTRRLIHEKYYAYKRDGEAYPVSVVSSLNNGLCGVMAILYGEGDFMRTVGIATSAGYDCDNQAATCAGLIGVMHGADVIPKSLTHEMPLNRPWPVPFNNRYVNHSRDNLPNVFTLDDLIDRTLAMAKKGVVSEEGRIETRDGEVVIILPQQP